MVKRSFLFFKARAKTKPAFFHNKHYMYIEFLSICLLFLLFYSFLYLLFKLACIILVVVSTDGDDDD